MPRTEELPPWMNTDKAKNIALYRAVGYSQKQIADQLGISQQTVSRYLRGLRDTAKGNDDLNKFFIGLLLGGAGAAFIAYLLSRK